MARMQPACFTTVGSSGLGRGPAALVFLAALIAGGPLLVQAQAPRSPTPASAKGAVRVETVAHGLNHPWALAFLPDGRRFLYFAASSQQAESAVYVGSLDSSERTRLFASEARAVYAAPGHLLFNRGDTVYAQAFDADHRGRTPVTGPSRTRRQTAARSRAHRGSARRGARARDARGTAP